MVRPIRVQLHPARRGVCVGRPSNAARRPRTGAGGEDARVLCRGGRVLRDGDARRARTAPAAAAAGCAVTVDYGITIESGNFPAMRVRSFLASSYVRIGPTRTMLRPLASLVRMPMTPSVRRPATAASALVVES